MHLGLGAFHRAHQARHLDDLRNAGLTTWSITGAGVRQADVALAGALRAQDWLCTLTERDDAAATTRVLGSLSGFVLGIGTLEPVVVAMADPATAIVSLTVTEGGYLVGGDGAYDPARRAQAVAAGGCGFDAIVLALGRRRAAGAGPLTVMSCDNLVANGTAARTSVLGVAGELAPQLTGWIEREVAFPCAMVDRITPAATEADRAWLRERHGIDDAAPVVCEPFIQWVLEDAFSGPRPPWEDAGVQLVADVSPHEHLKLALLNGAHSVLAYLAALRGIALVADAVRDPVLARFLEAWHAREAVPAVRTSVASLDADGYAATVRRRFANTLLGDTVARLCLDGSAKLPVFVLPTVSHLVASGEPTPLSALALAGWAHYLLGRTEAGVRFEPSADPGLDVAVSWARRAAADPAAFLDHPMFDGALRRAPSFRVAFTEAYARLATTGVEGAVHAALS